MSKERQCPICGNSKAFYPHAVHDGRTAEGLTRLRLTDGGHCLVCDYDSERKHVRGYVAVRSQPHFVYKESISDTADEALIWACLRFGYLSAEEAQADGWRTEWCEVVVLTEPKK